jgi:hypothetical protein
VEIISQNENERPTDIDIEPTSCRGILVCKGQKTKTPRNRQTDEGIG